MKAVGSLVLCVATLSSPGGAFLLPVSVTSTSRQCISNTAMLKSTSTTAVPTGRFAYILQAAAAGAGKEPDVSVFDAEGGVSWEEYKKEKPDEFKMNKVDEMQCWETDECPVEDKEKFTKAWKIRSAERNPTTETHFDSEGEWEEESKDAWSKKWYEDVGADDLHEEVASTPNSGYDI